MAALGAVAAVTVAVDGWFSSRVGLLARPPEYDGVSYMVSAQGAAQLFASLHIKTGLHALNATIAPLWTGALALHYLVFGTGAWQAFSARFWAVALLLVLVYWIVRKRAPLPLAVAAVAITALLPIVSAGVRSSSWEFLSGQVNYDTDFGLDDLRPDFLAAVLALWSVAALAEHVPAPRRSGFLLSALFAATAVLVKQSTSPLVLSLWAFTLAVTWFLRRRERSVTRMSLESVGLLVLVVGPWAVFEGGARNVVQYLYQTEVTYSAAYGAGEGIAAKFGYFLLQMPSELGQVEVWLIAIVSVLLVIALGRRRLGVAELMYAAVALLIYVAFSLSSSKNPHLGIWISTSLWIFVWAALARTATARWPVAAPRATRAVLAVAAAYTVIVYALGVLAVANWPADEMAANQQRLMVTAGIAHELSARISTNDCFTYAPGPGWPASIQFLAGGANGAAPSATATEVDTSVTTVGDYVTSARRCGAFLVYREDMAAVAKAFYAPPIYQPYFQAVADWVRSPGSGYVLDRTWTFKSLPPVGAHTLGRYSGISLTVDLYLRGPSP